MRLKTLISSLDCKLLGSDAEVTGISYNSKEIKREAEGGPLFAAIPGEHTDGHLYIKNAVENGASSILAERETVGIGVPQVMVKDIRVALSKLSDVFYERPSERLAIVGITGTNGKTTTTYLIESIFREAGLSPGVIGTVNYRYSGKILSAPHTTPQAPDLHRILKEMSDGGVTHLAMEVSSHSLEQKRVEDVRFRAAVFTNLTHDHLDYHKTMEEYFRCKALLFGLLVKGGKGVVNIDDRWGRKIKDELFPDVLTYSVKEEADFYPKEFKLLEGGIKAVINTPSGELNINSNLVGEYNLQNILSAVGAAYALGVEKGAIEKGIAALRRVPGRLEKIESGGPKRFRAYVDYAHTGDALERALAALKEVTPGRIITVFGCGGNRDRLKRPKMGEIAVRLSNLSIITSDNPRDEDPLEIIKEIEAGIKAERFGTDGPVKGKGYMVIPDRAEAIKKAVSLAEDGDSILLAGKGHEDYQIIKGKKHHFDDFEEVSKSIEDYGGAPLH